MNSEFIEIGNSCSGVILCKSLISKRLAGRLLEATITTGPIKESLESGPFVTYSVGNIMNVGPFSFMRILDLIHQKIAKKSHMCMGFDVDYIPNRHQFYSIKKQSIGQSHLIHSDYWGFQVEGTGREKVNMSSIISLSSDYEGGIFEVPEHNVSIKLEAGDCVFFPTWEHAHQVTEVTGGERHTLMHFWSP